METDTIPSKAYSKTLYEALSAFVRKDILQSFEVSQSRLAVTQAVRPYVSSLGAAVGIADYLRSTAISYHVSASEHTAAVHKHTALAICEHHKRTCDGATCNISLGSIRQMAEAAGVVFTAEECALFA